MSQQNTCICGNEYNLEPWMIELETVLCEPCFKREATIILLIQRTKQLKHERPYRVTDLIRHKEYDATKERLTN